MRVAILYDDVDARDATPDERGVLEARDAVIEALLALGHSPVPLPLGGPAVRWLERIRDAAADVVFNLCEGVHGHSAFEPHAAALVELLDLPMTGSPASTLSLARRKDHANAVLAAAGLPVPPWRRVAAPEQTAPWHRYPAIVKPAAEDASVGITQGSVVRDEWELREALDEARAHAPLLVQEYIAGREVNAGLLGDQMLPLSEIDFSGLPAGAWPIVSYRAKWAEGSDEDAGTRPVCPAPLEEADVARIASLARTAWVALEGRGYGRVDLRLDAEGRAHVLEVNPNPDLAPSAGLTRMAAAAGIGFEHLIARILDEALRGYTTGQRTAPYETGSRTGR